MSSVCGPSCLRGARDPGPGVAFRATYENLYKWPELDAEFVRSRSSRATVHGERETVMKKMVKCFEGVKERMGAHGKRWKKSIRRRK
ncbi:hypothetical protein V6N13_081177 [Hibiscus sabdariffa]|uniref:Uncharacterized protein n=1 Tax=Hibiscus sabdariffa TaxID=183260 RepID=A0ABR2DBQ0_9ROSI